jgi:hypothetical protein
VTFLLSAIAPEVKKLKHNFFQRLIQFEPLPRVKRSSAILTNTAGSTIFSTIYFALFKSKYHIKCYQNISLGASYNFRGNTMRWLLIVYGWYW